MKREITIFYESAPYSTQIGEFYLEIKQARNAGSLSIARMFTILPIQVRTPGGRERLEARGDGFFYYRSGRFVNQSDRPDHVDFSDDQLGIIEASIPELLTFSAQFDSDRVTLAPLGAGIAVKLVGLPLEGEIEPPLYLQKMEVGTGFMNADFHDRVGNLLRVRGEGSLFQSFAAGGDAACEMPERPETKWAVYRNQMNNLCSVQRTDSIPQLGIKIDGPFASKQEALDAMQLRIDRGECGVPPDAFN